MIFDNENLCKTIKYVICLSGFALMVIMTSSCASHYHASSMSKSLVLAQKNNISFKIRNVKLEGEAAGGAKYFTDYYSAVNVNAILRKHYSEIFTNAKNALPLEIDVSLTSIIDQNIAANLLSIGMLPAKNTLHQNVRVRVSIADDDYQQLLDEEVEYQTMSIRKVTDFSPLGLLPADSSDIDFEVNDELKGFSLGHKKAQEFYTKHLADAIVLAVQNANQERLSSLHAKWPLILRKREQSLMEKLNQE